MPNKKIRIIIADQRHEQRLHIEKMLNTLGYFRIIVAASFEDAWKLTQIQNCPVELLIIEESLIDDAPPTQPLKSSPQTPYILRYRSSGCIPLFTARDSFISSMPDLRVLDTVMGACSRNHKRVTQHNSPITQ